MRVCDLYNEEAMRTRMTTLFADAKAQYPEFDLDMEEEMATYKALAERVKPYVGDSIAYLNKVRPPSNRSPSIGIYLIHRPSTVPQ
eukprot:9306928-Pyramimonas_sp.AAC.1